MMKQRGEGGWSRRVKPLAEAQLCVDEHYYHTLARPLLASGGARRAQNLLAWAGPLLAAACALFIIGALALAHPVAEPHAPILGPLLARFSGVSAPIALGLIVASALGASLTLLSLWARTGRAVSRQAQEALDAKIRQARAYRQYLTELARLTEPLAWTQSTAPAIAGDAAGNERPTSLLIALTIRRESQRDDAELATLSDDGIIAYLSADGATQPLTATRPLLRSALDATLDAIESDLHPEQSVERLSQALASAASGAIILSGGAGAGKTIMLRHLAHAQAQAQLTLMQPGGRLPLYADLGWLDAEWPADGSTAVEGALMALVARVGGLERDDASALAHALATQPSLLLLDELDTLPSEQRDQVASSLATFLTQRQRLAAAPVGAASAWSAQVALGARSYDAPLGDGGPGARFERWRLEPLAFDAGRLALLRSALALRSGAPAPAAETPPANDGEAERLLVTLRAPETERWLVNPLSLTLAALAGDSGMRSSSQTELHRAVVWSRLCARQPGWTEGERLALLRLAEEVAFELHLTGRRAFTPGSEALDQRLRALPETAVALAQAGDDSPSRVLALQSGLCEPAPGGRVSFSLVTVQAFLAGCALARRVATERPQSLAPDALTTGNLIPSASGARLPKPLTPGGRGAVQSSGALTLTRMTPSIDRHTALGLAWDNLASARWADTLIFMCGALNAGPMRGEAEPESPARNRRDLAVAWLRALLAANDPLDTPEALSPQGILLAAASLPELGGSPANVALATTIATRLYDTLRRGAERASPAVEARLRQACVAVMADPIGRATLLELLTDQLLREQESYALQAAETFGALGQVCAQIAPHLIEQLGASEGASRVAVARALGALGPTAGVGAVPALTDAISDGSRAVRAAAADALGAIVRQPDETLTQAVIALLADRGGDVRMAAALALGKMGANSEEVAEALKLALRDREMRVAVAAASALGMVTVPERMVNDLIEALTISRWNDRAALALGALGGAAVSALPTLLNLTHAESTIVRESATRALAQIGPQRPEVVLALVEGLGDESPGRRRAAADALAQMDRTTEGITTRAWPALVNALRDSRGTVRWSAVRALGALGAMDDPAICATLFTLLDDPRGYVRVTAARALEMAPGAVARSMPAHVAQLASARNETCLVAIGELGALGANAKPALPALARLATDPRWEIRRASLRALRQIDPKHETTITRSIASANDDEAQVRLEALQSLGAQPPRHDRAALEALQRRLRDDSEGLARAEAARAMGRMGPRAIKALPLLVRALSDPDGDVRRAAALAVGALQPDVARVTPQLIETLMEPQPGPRSAVALAMGALGPRASATLTHELLTLLKDEFAQTRAAAAEALGHYGPKVGESAPTALLLRLTDKDGEVRAAAALALSEIGPSPEAGGYDATELEAALVERTDDHRYVVRRAAVAALTALGPAVVGRALVRLLELLTDENPSVREATLAALSTLDSAGRETVTAALTGWLGAASADRRTMAARALARLAPTLNVADRDALTLLLTDADDTTRAAAAHAIGALRATSFSGGPPSALGRLLADASWQARAAAAEALGMFGGQVNATDRRSLNDALADRDESIRHAATQSLALIQPGDVKALVASLLAMARTRQPTGAHTAIANRAEAEIYSAMTQPTWTVTRRVTAWISDGRYWATQLDALTLLGRWGYAPMDARRRLFTLPDDGVFPSVRHAAQVAFQAIETETGDFDQPTSAALADAWPMLGGVEAARLDQVWHVAREPELPAAPATGPLGARLTTPLAEPERGGDETTTRLVKPAITADDETTRLVKSAAPSTTGEEPTTRLTKPLAPTTGEEATTRLTKSTPATTGEEPTTRLARPAPADISEEATLRLTEAQEAAPIAPDAAEETTVQLVNSDEQLTGPDISDENTMRLINNERPGDPSDESTMRLSG